MPGTCCHVPVVMFIAVNRRILGKRNREVEAHSPRNTILPSVTMSGTFQNALRNPVRCPSALARTKSVATVSQGQPQVHRMSERRKNWSHVQGRLTSSSLITTKFPSLSNIRIGICRSQNSRMLHTPASPPRRQPCPPHTSCSPMPPSRHSPTREGW